MTLNEYKYNEMLTDGDVMFGGGYLLITREGEGKVIDGEMQTPIMKGFAFMSIGPTKDGRTKISVDSTRLRTLADHLIAAAERMDMGTVVPEPAPDYEPILLVTDAESGDTFFTGDLAAARVLVEKDRHIDVRTYPDHYAVSLIDDPDNDDSVAEWGSAASEESAMRFAFGAYFGPADDEYDEHRLLRALAAGTWNKRPSNWMALPPNREVEQIEEALKPDPWAGALVTQGVQAKVGPGKQDGTSDLDLPDDDERFESSEADHAIAMSVADDDLAPLVWCANDLHRNGEGKMHPHVRNEACIDREVDHPGHDLRL